MGDGGWWLGLAFGAALSAGCAIARGTGGGGPAPGMSGAAPEKVAAAPAAPARASASPTGKEAAGRRYVDPALGFEISRPVSGWQLETSDETTPEGLAIPVMLRHRDSGAQVVVQVAPAIASPTEFAERLTAGLRGYAGFTSGEPEPLPMREGAVGFGFELSGRVRGRVAVMEGGAGQMFIILATWPADVRDDVRVGVDEIFSSLRPVPKA